MIKNFKKNFGLHGLYKYVSALTLVLLCPDIYGVKDVLDQ